MEQLSLTTNEVAAYLIIFNVLLGIFFGTFPLIAGLKMKNRNYALYGFISSLIGGAILGVILSYPISIIFTWLILRNPIKTVEAIQENTVVSETEDSKNN